MRFLHAVTRAWRPDLELAGLHVHVAGAAGAIHASIADQVAVLVRLPLITIIGTRHLADIHQQTPGLDAAALVVEVERHASEERRHRRRGLAR